MRRLVQKFHVTGCFYGKRQDADERRTSGLVIRNAGVASSSLARGTISFLVVNTSAIEFKAAI